MHLLTKKHWVILTSWKHSNSLSLILTLSLEACRQAPHWWPIFSVFSCVLASYTEVVWTASTTDLQVTPGLSGRPQRLTTLSSSIWCCLWGIAFFLLILRTTMLLYPYCHPDGVQCTTKISCPSIASPSSHGQCGRANKTKPRDEAATATGWKPFTKKGRKQQEWRWSARSKREPRERWLKEDGVVRRGQQQPPEEYEKRDGRAQECNERENSQGLGQDSKKDRLFVHKEGTQSPTPAKILASAAGVIWRVERPIRSHHHL